MPVYQDLLPYHRTSLTAKGEVMTLKQRTDDELKKAIVDEIAWTPSVNSAHVGVAVNHGAVTLSGGVDSFPEKPLPRRRRSAYAE